jgi:hypothetical protein
MADIVDIKAARAERANGNGAREALVSVMETLPGTLEHRHWAEWTMIELWARGFKIVPLEEGES